MGILISTEDMYNLMLLTQCAYDASLPGGWLNTLLPLGATRFSKVCIKTLTLSDTDQCLKMLALPKDNVETLIFPILNVEERKRVGEKGRNGGLQLSAYDEGGRIWNLIFKYWDTSKTYVLIEDWKTMVDTNGWEVEVDTLSLWSFRFGCNDKLCFAFCCDGKRKCL
ncbi:hypothetical protein AMTR_s00023p00230620 [Amborella trichopoda]|uniref:TF-B3 domain-containing protein n=1 Tax=Amborella trichopoda TaxID=13333 RepID=W1NIX9_AMBTC|nr:hypothetical protein AMTR_s00023p00230620 [Amborella trichopoda]